MKQVMNHDDPYDDYRQSFDDEPLVVSFSPPAFLSPTHTFF